MSAEAVIADSLIAAVGIELAVVLSLLAKMLAEMRRERQTKV